MTILDLSADVGLLAVILATANICLGLLIAVRYSPWRLWPHRRINIFAIHTCTAYLLLASVLIHPVILLFSRSARWRLVDVGLPLWSPVQPVENTIGAVGLYLILVVLLTSYFRLRIGRRRWKLFHYLVYAAAVCILIHGLLADPQLKGLAIDPLDGEKLLVESCGLIVAIVTTWAWRYRLRKGREERVFSTGP
jgi:predicted ferric reductase